ncbi:UDP-3-O-(3-hydroxymyristoyl)glucosamine N-acyltransferase [Amorphus orientalis]|uniref:UDP-3-O-acylglucosamine N-acyltransferase n=1 Tax=Amorphus orientalis TaxID=649198 RepID=A0AAE4ARW3_9HYPH|nr:UDP-3-O-(3-hydroxymyristoyl)glucosamine N-acyltransferase [Amorphus orientalis]MDQ0315551.1 UDP-3-O-[3-hydroxymyristoyl] glucosamine N-acyltransferase [Amorphus orientalis]
MSDPSFFAPPVPLSLDEVASLTGAVLVRGDAQATVSGVAALDRAGTGDLSFVEDKAYWPKLAESQAVAVVCREADVPHVPERMAVLTAGAPYRAFAAVAGKLFPAAVSLPAMTGVDGISPFAHVDETAELEPGVIVEPGAVVGPHVQIGSGTVIGPNAVIAQSCRIGRNCRIGAGSVLQFSLIGDRVILHPGVKLGQDGFGYSMGMKHMKIPQLGRLIVQDDVEIGANTTIDRGSLRDTVIGEGSKIDNLVQIGHNVVIGRHCVIVAEVGISGSAELGDYVVLGGGAAVGEHIKIGTGAQIAGTSAVNDDVPAGERWLGHPAVPFRRWMRERMAVRALANKRGSGARKEDGKTSGEETAE